MTDDKIPPPAPGVKDAAAADKPAFPPEYYDQIRAMDEAARAWQRAHPFSEPRIALKPFESEMKRRAGRPDHEEVMIAAALPDAIPYIALNEDARQLLLEMNRASGHQATYLQAKVLIEMQIEARIERGQGQMTAPGDWRCPCCSKLLDGYNRLDGEGGAPGAGMLSICAYCGGLSRVNDAQNAFVSLTEVERRALPSDVRRQIHQLRNAMQARAAKEARRS